jgi:hypothetical protein
MFGRYTAVLIVGDHFAADCITAYTFDSSNLPFDCYSRRHSVQKQGREHLKMTAREVEKLEADTD